MIDPPARQLSDNSPDDQEMEPEEEPRGGLFARLVAFARRDWFPEEASSMGRGTAVVHGIGATAWRVFLTCVMLVASVALFRFYEWGCQEIAPVLGLNCTSYHEGLFAVFLWFLALLCGIGIFWVILGDTDGQWRYVNWLCFIIVVIGTLTSYGTLELFLPVLGLQGYGHLRLHRILSRGEIEWHEQWQDRAANRAARPRRPALLSLYPGVGGFQNGDSGTSPGGETRRNSLPFE